MLTQEKLQELLSYDEHTGYFKWISRSSIRINIGSIAGSYMTNGYICIGIEGKLYLAHRLAWLYMTGGWPEDQIDHVNCTKDDNRWVNIREASSGENNRNQRSNMNATGFKGVYANRLKTRYVSQIEHKGKTYTLGSFPTPEKAHKAYCDKADELFGDFANYG